MAFDTIHKQPSPKIPDMNDFEQAKTTKKYEGDRNIDACYVFLVAGGSGLLRHSFHSRYISAVADTGNTVDPLSLHSVLGTTWNQSIGLRFLYSSAIRNEW